MTSITASPTSAISFASTRVPIAHIGENVGEVRDRLVGGDRLESAAQIAVLHDGQLQGLVRIEDLLSSARDVPVVSVMDSDPPVAICTSLPGPGQPAAKCSGSDSGTGFRGCWSVSWLPWLRLGSWRALSVVWRHIWSWPSSYPESFTSPTL